MARSRTAEPLGVGSQVQQLAGVDARSLLSPVYSGYSKDGLTNAGLHAYKSCSIVGDMSLDGVSGFKR